jgi:molybdopterin/thiamine biosynthesis adenylyltransferase/rhodanese-related sulfurtransferase
VEVANRRGTPIAHGACSLLAHPVLPHDAYGRSAPEVDVIAPVEGAESALPVLNANEVMRFSRHLILPDVGMSGQRRLKAARVLLVGTGGLGSPLALYLAAAGVGTLGLVDFDVVDESNLQRQVLHGTRDIGRRKLDSAADRIADINPHVQVVKHHGHLDSFNALDIIAQYDIVVDGTDNFPTRYLVNDACVLSGKPNVYGSVFRFEGQVAVFGAPDGPCYRCLFREPPPAGLVPSCAEGGVLGVLPGIIGCLQALETIKLIVGLDGGLVGRMLLFDGLPLTFREIRIRRDPTCAVCGEHPGITTLVDYAAFCGVGAAQEPAPVAGMSPVEFRDRVTGGERFTLIDVREPVEWDIANLAEYGARLIPLGTLDSAIGGLDLDAPIVVHCKAGGRSAKAVHTLLDAGARQVWNLDGGILAWSDAVDPTKQKY